MTRVEKRSGGALGGGEADGVNLIKIHYMHVCEYHNV
jgi:hypothetical protein